MIEQVPIQPPFQEYVDWSLKKQLGLAEMFVNSGVRTLFMPVLGPKQIREVGAYRDYLFNMYKFIFEPHALELYKRLGIRNRFLGKNFMTDEFSAKASDLEHQTVNQRAATFFWVFVGGEEQNYEIDAINTILKNTNGQTNLSREACLQALYGEQVPAVDMFIGFSKPHVGYWMPPLLGHNAALYFTDYPSYFLDERDWKRIIYDFGITRKTWTEDKSARYANILTSGLIERHAERRIWGVGSSNIGGFWYQEVSEGRE